MFSKTKRVHAPAQNPQIQVPDSSLPLRSKVERVFLEYSRQGGQCLIQFWQCNSPQGSRANGFDVKTKGQPFRIPQFNVHLDRYRKSCVDKGCSFVGRKTSVGTWLAGRAIQTRLADQGTIGGDGSHNQELGLLVMPVLLDRGTHKETVGVIELVTLVPKQSYGEEFDRINNLLKNESLESGGMGKTIKVRYEDEMIKFTFSISAEFKDLQKEVIKRFKTLKHERYLIEYEDRNGNSLPIERDADLKACIKKSVSQESTVIKMSVKLLE